MNKLIYTFLFVFLVACLGFVFPLHSEAADKAIIVFDASGSMMGQIKGKPKIDIARKTIEKLLKEWDSSILLGITAYGHRKKGDCNDIEAIVPLGKVNAKNIMTAINKIHPKGKTPLSSAVRLAAKELKYTEDKATVILVSDGKETCNADPCALAKDLEKNGIDFTVHVIGFDMTEEEQAQLTCLAKNTGGKFFSADNSNELHQALVKTTKIIAQPKPKKEKKGITGLKLHAVLKKGGDPIKESMGWWVYEAKKDINGNRKEITSTGAVEPLFRLNAGKYYVYTRHGNAATDFEVEIKEGKLTEKTISLNAGYLKLHAVLKRGGDPIRSSMGWWVYEAKKDINGKRKEITSTGAVEPLFRLNSGKYYIYTKHGDKSANFEITIKSGKIVEKTILLKK
jgi:Ca-activated chloride channel family protein